MPLILGGQSAAVTAFAVDNSCRFNGVDEYLTKTLGTPTSGVAWTFSCWFKKCSTAAEQCVFTGREDGSNEMLLKWDTNSNGYWYEFSAGMQTQKITDAVYRDPNAWFHFCYIWDSDDSTDEDKQRIYINNVRVTDFSTSVNPSAGYVSIINSATGHYIGAAGGGTTMFTNGYLAEVVLIDGLSLEPTSFGQFNEDSPTIWEPVDPSGLTFGNNGFYLDFEDSADLGADVSGNSNDWALTNIDSTNQATDTPTNNFVTYNALDSAVLEGNLRSAGTYLTQGNTEFVVASGTTGFAKSTIPFTAGKWYWENKLNAVSKGFLGVTTGNTPTPITHTMQGIWIYEAVPDFRSGTQDLTTGILSISADDILNFALDMDNNAFYIGVNNTWMNSGDPTSGASRTGAISELFTDGRAVLSDYGEIFVGLVNTSTTGGINTSGNFGNPSYANTSDAADENGYGAFEYAPPSGYYAMCTKNLAEFG